MIYIHPAKTNIKCQFDVFVHQTHSFAFIEAVTVWPGGHDGHEMLWSSTKTHPCSVEHAQRSVVSPLIPAMFDPPGRLFRASGGGLLHIRGTEDHPPLPRCFLTWAEPPRRRLRAVEDGRGGARAGRQAYENYVKEVRSGSDAHGVEPWGWGKWLR